MVWPDPVQPASSGEWPICVPPKVTEPDIREYQADFERDPYAVAGTSTTRRPDAVSLDYQRAWSVGPRERADNSAGLVDRAWRIRADNETGSIFLRRAAVSVAEPQAGWSDEELLFSYAGDPIQEVDLAFDQNGNTVVCAQRSDDEVWLYWFSPLAGTHVFEKIADGRNPRLLLDDPIDTSNSDLLLFYVDDVAGTVMVRTQRDLYAAPVAVPMDRWFDAATGEPLELEGTGGLFLEDVARSVGLRLLILASLEQGGQFRLILMQSVPYPPKLLDSAVSEALITEVSHVEVVKPADWQLDSALMDAIITSLAAIELIAIIGPDGPEGFLDADSAEMDAYIISANVQELLIVESLQDEFTMDHRITSATVTTYVLVAATLMDSFQMDNRITSLALAAP